MNAEAPSEAVLLVIPTLNEEHHIAGVIDALLQGLPDSLALTVAVVDGGSTDATPQIVQGLARRDPRVRWLHNPQRIQSAAVNLAARQLGAAAHTLLRCDAHADYPPGFVPRLLEALRRTGADSVVVPMDSSGSGCLQRAVAWVSNSWAGTGGSAHRAGRRSGDVDHGHHAAFRMAAFARAGGYDESFTHNEDAELDCRLRRLGGRIYLDADIRIGYHPRATLGALAAQYFRYGRGRSRTVRRHRGSLRLRQLVLPLHLVGMGLCLLALPWWPGMLAWPAAYLLALLGTSLGLALRHRSACGLLCGVAAGVMHTSWAAGFLQGLLTLRERRWDPAAHRPLQAGGDGGVPA